MATLTIAIKSKHFPYGPLLLANAINKGTALQPIAIKYKVAALIIEKQAGSFVSFEHDGYGGVELG